MLSDYFDESVVKIDADVKDAESAIKYSGDLLLRAGFITNEYINAMIDTYRNLGPYIVVAPGIAIPHSKPGMYVNKTCISFCRLKKPIIFNHPTNDPVSLIFAIGGRDKTAHLGMLKDLSSFLMISENIEKLKSIKNEHEFIELIKKGGGR